MVISMFLQYMSVPYHLRSEATKRGGGRRSSPAGNSAVGSSGRQFVAMKLKSLWGKVTIYSRF